MLKRVKSRTYAHNNRNIVAKNPFLTWIKLTYYRIFAWVKNMDVCVALLLSQMHICFSSTALWVAVL